MHTVISKRKCPPDQTVRKPRMDNTNNGTVFESTIPVIMRPASPPYMQGMYEKFPARKLIRIRRHPIFVTKQCASVRHATIETAAELDDCSMPHMLNYAQPRATLANECFVRASPPLVRLGIDAPPRTGPRDDTFVQQPATDGKGTSCPVIAHQ